MAREDAQYVRTERTIWNKPRFRALSEDAQKLLLYIIICPHGNMTGMFTLRRGYASEDLGWETNPERFTKGLQELVKSRHIKYDEKTKVVLDLNQIVKFPPQNQNMVTGAISKLNELPYTPLFQDLIPLVEECKIVEKVSKEPICKPLLQWLHKRLGKGLVQYEEVDEEEKEDEAEKQPPVDNSSQDTTYEAYAETIQPLFNKALNIYPKLNLPLFLSNHQPHKGNEPAHFKAMEHAITRLIESSSKKLESPYKYLEKVYIAELQNYNAAATEAEGEQYKKRGNLKNIFAGMGMAAQGGAA